MEFFTHVCNLWDVTKIFNINFVLVHIVHGYSEIEFEIWVKLYLVHKVHGYSEIEFEIWVKLKSWAIYFCIELSNHNFLSKKLQPL